MRTKAAFFALTTLAVLLVTSPAYASSTLPSEPPPSDNGKWVGLVAFIIFAAVVGGMLFIANAYRKNNQDPNNQR